MRMNVTLASLVAATLLLVPALAHGQSAQETFAKAEALLARGDFAAALQSYAAAAQADRGNRDYLQHYAMVRRIVDLRSRLETEKDPEQWEYLARALRAFYVSEKIYPEALSLDEKTHARLGSTTSAVMLAETQLSMDRGADAVRTLSALGADKATPTSQTLLGIAMARTGKKAEARQIAAALVVPSDAGAGTVYAAARLHAAVGDTAKAYDLLKACIESVPPSRQAGFKDHAKASPEFAAVAATSEFARVLDTPSKVPESKCSGGKSCAGCPMSGKCAHGQGQ